MNKKPNCINIFQRTKYIDKCSHLKSGIITWQFIMRSISTHCSVVLCFQNISLVKCRAGAAALLYSMLFFHFIYFSSDRRPSILTNAVIEQ